MPQRSETADRAIPGLSRPPFAALWTHTLQLMLAIVIIGLDIYGMRYVAYSALVCSLVVATCTIPVCIYLIAAHSYLKRLYSPYIAAAYHVWMLIFWIIDLGLAANLVKLWTRPECDYDSEQGYPCVPLEKRAQKGMVLRSYNTYHGVLVAGALLAGFELALWVLSSSALIFNLKYRTTRPVELQPDVMQQSTISHHPAIPFQDISNTNYTGVFHIPAPSDPWNWHRPCTPPESRQEIIPEPVTTDESRSGPPSQDIPREPFARLTFGSPEPSTRESSMDIKSFICRQPAASADYHPPAKHQSTGPPGDTQQIDWSEGSSLYTTNPNSVSAGSTSDGRIRRLTMGDLQLEL